MRRQLTFYILINKAIMIQSSVLIEDQDPIQQSPFRPLLQEARTYDEPLICIEFRRCKNNKIVALKIFDDRVVGACGQAKSVLLFEDQILFGFSIKEKKLWFQNRENQDKCLFTSENEENLFSFVQQLKTKCPQQNFSSSYQMLEQKGKGKNSSVFEAKRKEDGASFAVKVQTYNSAIKKQIQILKELQHPNIIYFREYFIESDLTVYVVMDYEDGGSLLDIIKNQQQFSSKEKVKLFTDLLNGLQYLRIKGIVHRDLKPENILFCKKDGNYKIADFGLSKRVGEKIEKIAGTPGYIAPQLLKEESKQMLASVKSDIYSMGLIFYEILTFQQYYSGKDSEQILKKNMEKTSLKKKNKCEQSMNKLQYILLQKMIRSDPEKRKTTFEILKSDLFSKINKAYGIQLLSSTSPSKKISEDEDEKQQVDESLVGSLWKLLRIRSWSS